MTTLSSDMLSTAQHNRRGGSIKRHIKAPNPANPEEYDRDFYDRFGHNIHLQKTSARVYSVSDSAAGNAAIAIEAGTKRNSGTSSVQGKPRVTVSEAEIEEMIQTLPPLPTHLNYVRTRPSSFNFNSLSFDLMEYGQIREREKLAEKLAIEKKLRFREEIEAATSTTSIDSSDAVDLSDDTGEEKRTPSLKALGKRRAINHVDPHVAKWQALLTRGTILTFAIDEDATLERNNQKGPRFNAGSGSDGGSRKKQKAKFKNSARGNDLSRGPRNHDREGRRNTPSAKEERPMFAGYVSNVSSRGLGIAILSSAPSASPSASTSTPSASPLSKIPSPSTSSLNLAGKRRRGVPVGRYKHPSLPISPTGSSLSSSSFSGSDPDSSSSLGSSFFSVAPLDSIHSIDSSTLSNSVLSPGSTTLFDPSSPFSSIRRSETTASETSNSSSEAAGRSFLHLSSSEDEDDFSRNPPNYFGFHKTLPRKNRISLPIYLHDPARPNSHSTHPRKKTRRPLSEPCVKVTCQSPYHPYTCMCPPGTTGKPSDDLNDLLYYAPIPPCEPFHTSYYPVTPWRKEKQARSLLQPSHPLPSHWGDQIYAYRPTHHLHSDAHFVIGGLDTDLHEREPTRSRQSLRPGTKTTFGLSSVLEAEEEFDLIDEESERKQYKYHHHYHPHHSSPIYKFQEIADPIIPLPSSTPKHPGSSEEWAMPIVIDASFDLNRTPSLIRDPSEFDTIIERLHQLYLLRQDNLSRNKE